MINSNVKNKKNISKKSVKKSHKKKSVKKSKSKGTRKNLPFWNIFTVMFSIGKWCLD